MLLLIYLLTLSQRTTKVSYALYIFLFPCGIEDREPSEYVQVNLENYVNIRLSLIKAQKPKKSEFCWQYQIIQRAKNMKENH